MVSPFRWDHRFTAFIINSPVYYNNSHPDLKDSFLSYICGNTNGQVLEVTPASILQTCVRQFLKPSSDPTVIASGTLAPLFPSILVQVNSSFVGQQRRDALSIVVPLIDSSSDLQCTHNELVDRFYASASDSPLFYCYPEQGAKRSMFPVFQLRSVMYNEKESMEKLLADCKLPFDLIKVDLNAVVESTCRALELLLQEVVNIREKNGVPFLFGEDEKVYGMIRVPDQRSLQLLFFPPDFPVLMDFLKNNQIMKIVEWVRTIPLEYLPPIYAFLTRKNIQLPSPLPRLPPREKNFN